MLVGQFGSFIGQFLKIWTYKVNKGEVEDIEEGDVFITNGTAVHLLFYLAIPDDITDVYEVEGAVSHLNDVSLSPWAGTVQAELSIWGILRMKVLRRDVFF